MRNSVWMLIFLLAGCHKEPSLSVSPSQLIGTWNSPSALTLPTEKPFTRWTFTSKYVYMLTDTLKSCQPIDNNSYYAYWVENDMLVMQYAGITNGLVPIPDIRRRISSITATEIVFDSPRQVLEKCP